MYIYNIYILIKYSFILYGLYTFSNACNLLKYNQIMFRVAIENCFDLIFFNRNVINHKRN